MTVAQAWENCPACGRFIRKVSSRPTVWSHRGKALEHAIRTENCPECGRKMKKTSTPLGTYFVCVGRKPAGHAAILAIERDGHWTLVRKA